MDAILNKKCFGFRLHSCKTIFGNEKKITEFGVKECSTGSSFGWRSFGKFEKTRKIYTFTSEYVKDLVRKPVKVGRVADLTKN